MCRILLISCNPNVATVPHSAPSYNTNVGEPQNFQYEPFSIDKDHHYYDDYYHRTQVGYHVLHTYYYVDAQAHEVQPIRKNEEDGSFFSQKRGKLSEFSLIVTIYYRFFLVFLYLEAILRFKHYGYSKIIYFYFQIIVHNSMFDMFFCVCCLM